MVEGTIWLPARSSASDEIDSTNYYFPLLIPVQCVNHNEGLELRFCHFRIANDADLLTKRPSDHDCFQPIFEVFPTFDVNLNRTYKFLRSEYKFYVHFITIIIIMIIIIIIIIICK